MATTNRDLRNRSYGQTWHLTPGDRLGVWLSALQVRRQIPNFRGLDVADIGCGYHATFARTLLDSVRSLSLVDLAIAPDLHANEKTYVIEGQLPGALERLSDSSLDVIVCNSVLEHLWEPLETLSHFRRLLRPGGLALVNVPSWRGKTFLELSAFRLHLSPPDEMNDHKAYYDPRDLWPLLVRGGFLPREIRCFTHKLGLNTFAVCRRAAEPQL